MSKQFEIWAFDPDLKRDVRCMRYIYEQRRAVFYQQLIEYKHGFAAIVRSV